MTGWRGLSLGLACCALLLPGAIRAQGDEKAEAASQSSTCAARVAERVQAHYEAVRDVAARFEQSMHSSLLGAGSGASLSTGRVVLSKPGRMRWTYESPGEHVVISDGDTLWLYDADAREVQRMQVTQGYLAGAGLQFLLGEGRLARSFVIDAESCSPEADFVDLRLTPRADASYERIGLRVQPGSGQVIATSMIDLFGNETRIAFSDLRVNQDPGPEVFRFVTPPGVEVIDLVSPP